MAWKNTEKWLSAIDQGVDRTASVLIIVGGVLITLTVILQVVLRYIFKAPLFGLEELSRLIAVWVYFLGAFFGTKFDCHVQGDVAGRLFPTARGRSAVKSAAWLLSLLVCVLFLIHAGAYSIWIYNTGERTTGLWWPRITSVGSMFFGAVLMTVYSLVNVVKYTKAAARAEILVSGGAS